jgi:putative two-component system response regulator
VLLKPGRLSDEEFDIMKEHTTIGARTLEAAARRFPNTKFLQMARDIAATHHERYDGSGYPAGLKGEEIPLCGRIVALADVYDALTSKRVYKEAYTHIVAKNIITREAHTHFAPEIVEAFVASEAAFIAVRRQFQAELAQAA